MNILTENNNNLKTWPSVDKVMYTIVFWVKKGMIHLDFLEPGQSINFDSYITMLTKMKAQIHRVRPEKRTTSL